MTTKQVVLVVGGSSGIGLSCAQELAVRGHYVYGSSRRAEFPAWGFAPIQIDVCSDASVEQAVSRIIRERGRIDVVINSAGYGLAGAVEDTSLAEAQAQMDTNFFGVLRVCKAVLPHMRAQRSGLIINISSLAGGMGLPFQGIYCASKFAVEGLTESLRQEALPFGVRVVSVQPGDVRTPITDNRVLSASAQHGSSYRAMFQRTLEVIEAGERAGVHPDAIARQTADLLSVRRPAVSYMVGLFAQRLAAQLKRVLPQRLFERLLMSHYHVGSPS